MFSGSIGGGIINQRRNILLLLDIYNWSFHNIAKKIQSNIKEHDIDILTTLEYRNKLKTNYDLRYTNKHIEEKHYFIIILFFPSAAFNISEIEYIKKSNNAKIYICLYDNFAWREINTIPSLQSVRTSIFYNIKTWLGYSDGYLYASPHIKKSLEENFYKETKNKVNDYCMDGVDTRMFKFKPYENDILTKKKLKIGWIGNSDVKVSGIQKGYAEIKQYISDLSANFEFCPLDKQIKQIPHNEVPEYIHNIDIIVCYSTCEGTPNQILEGSSCGRCWVSTNVGIVSSVYTTLPNNPTGIIINKNEQSLKKALLFLYNNRELIVKYGMNGRKAIEVKWDWKNRLDGFKRIMNMNMDIN